MAYAPTTTDRSDQYIFNSMQSAQDRNLEQQGMQAEQMQGYMQMGQQSIGDALSKFDEQNQLRDMARGKLGAHYDAGLMDEDTLNKVIKMKPAEMYGYLAVQEQKFADQRRDQYQEQTYDKSRALADYKLGLSNQAASFRNNLPPRQSTQSLTPPATQFQIADGINIF